MTNTNRQYMSKKKVCIILPSTSAGVNSRNMSLFLSHTGILCLILPPPLSLPPCHALPPQPAQLRVIISSEKRIAWPLQSWAHEIFNASFMLKLPLIENEETNPTSDRFWGAEMKHATLFNFYSMVEEERRDSWYLICLAASECLPAVAGCMYWMPGVNKQAVDSWVIYVTGSLQIAIHHSPKHLGISWSPFLPINLHVNREDFRE